MVRVAVAGASGYAGGELLRLIAGHPQFQLGMVTGDASAGKTVGEVHRHLAGHDAVAGHVFQPHQAITQDDADLVFLALPSGQSAAVAAELPGQAKVVDLGADFRLASAADWARHYGGAHAGRWVTGLPELPGARAKIKAAARVAAPGCYATAAILALAPLAGLVQTEDLVVVAASGTSGAGKSLRADLLGSEVLGSVSAYQVGGVHRHTPEIEQALLELTPHDLAPHELAPHNASGGAVSVSFTPLLAPMPRGILATATARLTDPGVDSAALRDALATMYKDEPFVCVLPEGQWPATAAVAGSNGVHLQAAADHRAGRAVVIAAIDNLGKGAAGQAVQNANLMLGQPETAGLTSIGVAP